MRRLPIAFAALAAPGIALALNLEIEGISIGQSQREFLDAHRGIQCRDLDGNHMHECVYRTADNTVKSLATVASQPTRAWTFDFLDGRLVHVVVTLPSTSADGVRGDLLKRFGQPAQVVNSGSSRVSVWGDDAAGLALRDFIDANTSGLTLMSNSFDYKAWIEAGKKKRD